VKNKFKELKTDFKEKCEKITKKHSAIDLKIDEAEQRKKIQSLKHREIENLKCQDLSENIDTIKTNKVKRDCQTVEKHLALSIMNNERKNLM